MKPSLPPASDYQLEAELYVGDPWQIFSGCDRHDGTQVLILMLDAPYAGVDAVKERFLSGAPECSRRARTAMMRFKDELAIPLILEAQRTESGSPYQVIERYQGSGLDTQLDRLPPEQGIALLRSLAGCLAELASLGIVHGHLEASSLLLGPQGRRNRSAVLLDLGKAALWAEYTRETGTPPPNRWRNSPYRAPEQRGAQEITLTSAADVYSFGVLLWELLSGRPFAAAATLAPEQLPPRARLLLRALLAPDPQKRPSFPQLANELSGLLLDGEPAVGAGAAKPQDGPAPGSAASPEAGGDGAALQGETLAERLRRVRQLDEQSAVSIAVTLLSILGEKRQSSERFAAVTPSDVRLLPADRQGSAERVVLEIATPPPAAAPVSCFAAPEGLDGAAGNPEALDVYNAGAVLFAMLGGRAPLELTPELVASVRDGGTLPAPPPLQQLRPSLLPELAQLCDAMLIADAANRLALATAQKELRWFQRLIRVRDYRELIDGQYQIETLLQIGGTAATFRAVNQRTGGLIAVKIPRPDFTESRFLQEIRVGAGVLNQDLVKIYSAGRLADGTPFFAMEFLHGVSLDVLLRQQGDRIEEPLVLHLALGVARALQALHERKIIHRDVAAENVMVVEDPQVPFGMRSKLIDLGVAKVAEGVPGRQMKTQIGSRLGRQRYWPPEQEQDASEVTEKADVFAFAVVMAELLGCKVLPPHLPLPSGRWSRGLALLLTQMLSRAPELRPPMSEVVNQLLALQRGRPRARLSWRSATIGVLALAVTLGLIFGRPPQRFMPPSPPPPLPLPAQLPPPSVLIDSQPSGAEIWDRKGGALLGETPRQFACSGPGSGGTRQPIALELRKVGYELRTIELEPCQGQGAAPHSVGPIVLKPVLWRIAGRPGGAVITDPSGSVLERIPASYRPGERFLDKVLLTFSHPCYADLQRTFSPYQSESFYFQLERRRGCGRRSHQPIKVTPPVSTVPADVHVLKEEVNRKLVTASQAIDQEGPSSRTAVRELIDATKLSLQGSLGKEVCEISAVWHRYSTKQCGSMDDEATRFVIATGGRMRERCPASELTSKDMTRYRGCAEVPGR